jgi:hypothetical protein
MLACGSDKELLPVRAVQLFGGAPPDLGQWTRYRCDCHAQ